MSGLCVSNAVQVAEGKYHEDGMKMDFMAVNALNDALVEAVGLDKTHIDGIGRAKLEDSLALLLTRYQHSEEFYGLIEAGRQNILYAAQQGDRRILADLKNWDALTHDGRLSSANYFAGVVRDIFVAHIGLPPDTGIAVRPLRAESISAVDLATFGIHLPAPLEKDVSDRYPEEIVIDTADADFQDGYAAYTNIYADYLRLIEKGLAQSIVREKFQAALQKIPQDIELCRAAFTQSAFIDPLLKDVKPYHFSDMLVTLEGYEMERNLQQLVATHDADIPVYQRYSLPQKMGLFLGFKGIHL